jgi:hypothetical protein
MKDTELFDWLLDEALTEELSRLVQITVATEITNLDQAAQSENPQEEFNWKELLLAGSILARSDQRVHQEAALRIATAAVTLDTAQDVRDAGAVLLEKLSNHRAVELALKRGHVAQDLEGRLGVAMRIEAYKRRFDDSVLLSSSGKWISVNDFQRDLWSGVSSEVT